MTSEPQFAKVDATVRKKMEGYRKDLDLYRAHSP